MSLKEIERNSFMRIFKTLDKGNYRAISSILLENLLYDKTINLKDKIKLLLSLQNIILDIIGLLQMEPCPQIDSNYIILDEEIGNWEYCYEECLDFSLYE